VGAARRGRGGAEALAEAGDTSGAVSTRSPFFDAHWKWLRLIKERHKFFTRGYSCKGLRSGRRIGPAFAAVPRLGWRLGSSLMPLRQARRTGRGLMLRRLQAAAKPGRLTFLNRGRVARTTRGRAGGRCAAR